MDELELNIDPFPSEIDLLPFTLSGRCTAGAVVAISGDMLVADAVTYDREDLPLNSWVCQVIGLSNGITTVTIVCSL